MSYLIADNKVVAKTSEKLMSGEEVRVSWLKTGNSLVNAIYAKVSNAKKWESTYENPNFYDTAKLHDDTGLYKDFFATSYSE